MELLSSRELAGNLGLEQPLAKEASDAELESKIQDSLEELKASVEAAEDFADLVICWTEMLDTHYEPEIDLDRESAESPAPDSLMEWLSRVRVILEWLDDLSGRGFYDTSVAFVDELYNQKMLRSATITLVYYFTEDVEHGVRYVNRFMTGVLETVSKLSQFESSDDVDIRDLVEVYRKSATYYEFALPPMLVLIDHLEGEQDGLDYQKYASMRLSNSLSKLRSFEPLAEFAESYDTNIRNAVSHGGSSGHSINQIEETITFRYKVGDSVHTETMDFEEFRILVIEGVSGAIALFLLPFFIVLICTYYEIMEKVESAD